MSTTREKTRKLVLTALFAAIITLMTFVPYLGYIQIPPSFSITTLHIPVIIGAILLGTGGGTILGGVWGVTCLINAFFINPVEGILFMNPLISVVPRILVGFITGFLATLLMKRIKNIGVASGITAAVGTLSNTILVLTAVGLFGNNLWFPLGDTLKQIFEIIIGTNGLIELAAAVILVPTIVYALKRSERKV